MVDEFMDEKNDGTMVNEIHQWIMMLTYTNVGQWCW
jgi:hypothetical protein